MSTTITISFDSDSDDEIEEVDKEKKVEKKPTTTPQQPIKQSPSKLQNGSIKTIGKLLINQSTKSSTINCGNIARYTALIERKIEMLKFNQLQKNYGEKMETYKQIVLEIMQAAASQENLIHMDRNWLTNQINERANDEDEQYDLQSIVNNIDELAQTAIYEAKLQNQSISLLANRVRRARIDEVQRIEEERTLKQVDRIFPGKRKLFMQRIKKEEYSSSPTESSDTANKFLLNNEDDYIGDIFSKSTSPPSQPPEMEMEEIDLWNANDNDDIELKEEEEEEKVKPAKYRDHPIADIIHRPKNDQIRQPTKRQELIQRITNHIPYMPENIQQKKSNSTKYGNEQKKQINNKVHQISTKRARLQNGRTSQTANVDTDNDDPELEDYLNGSLSSSADYCEYNRTVKNISYENETKVKFEQIHVNVKIMKKSCLKKSDGLKAKKKIKFVAEIEENEGKSKNNPEYANHFYHPNDGQRTYKFTCPPILSSRENLQLEANCKMVPSSDKPIMIKMRENPYKNHKNEQDRIKKEIENELVKQIKFTMFSDSDDGENKSKRYHSRLFIMDSILAQLDKTIFKNMSTFNLSFPRMPNWFIQGLENWWKANINRTIQQYFCYSKVFILLGMDLNIFYADPVGSPNQIVYSFLTDLNNWFDQKIKSIHQNLKQNDNAIWEKLTFEIKNTRRLFLNQKPQFVVITIPEVGDWEPFFHVFNKELREFVANNSANFTLLDWADELEKLKKVNPLNVATVEQRTAILIKRMHTDHAVLYI